MVEKKHQKTVSRRSIIKSVGASAGISGISVLSSQGVRASSTNLSILVLNTVPFVRDWNGDNNDLRDRSASGVNTYMGASIQQIWSDGVAPDDGRYDVNFKWGDHGGVKATNVSSNYLSTRANQYDEYLRNSSYWKKTYDDADGILLLDYNSGKDINLGDASACYGKIGGAAGSEQKTAIVDMAFFENATWEYDSGGFFADTFAKGTGFRAAGLLFNVYSDSAGTRTINGLPQYSLATRGGGLKSGASCGNVDSNASKQANFVSNCTQNQIQNWVDNYM